MVELKAALKAAKKFLSENHSEEALSTLQEFLDENVEDYMLFCFSALAYANIGNANQARLLYEKALKLDGTTPVAWQGLYKLYESGKLQPDNQAIEVCDHLISMCDSEEKQRCLHDCLRRFLFELCHYDRLLNDLGSNTALLGKVIERLAKKDSLSNSESLLLEKSFTEVKSSLVTNAEWNLHYCRFLYKNRVEDWMPELTKFCVQHSYTEIVWVKERLLEILCTGYFCHLRVKDDVLELYSKCTSPRSDAEGKTFELLSLLRDADMLGALDVVDELSEVSLLFLPLAMVAVHLLAEVENWESLSRIIDWMQSQNLSERCNNVALALKRRVFLETNNIDGATRIKVPLSHLPPSFTVDCARLALLKGDDIGELIRQCNQNSIDSKRFCVARGLGGSLAEAVNDTEALLSDESVTWRDLVLVAELYIVLNRDPTSLLVKAAKMNPRSSRVFFVLGKTLLPKNPTKAKSCLERAVKIRPTNEEYVKVLDDLYETVGETVERRLSVLMQSGTQSKPMWLRKRLAALSKITEDWDTVISELQQIVRSEPNDALNWACLAEAYSRRGNLQSSVNAYDRVLELDPTSDYAICLIQVLMRMHNLEGAAEQCARWRALGSRNSQLAIAVDILEAQVRLRLFKNCVGPERTNTLKTVFDLLDRIISERPRISLAYKLAADALLHAIKFKDESMKAVGIPSSWSVFTRSSAARTAVMFYSVALDLNHENAWAWYDLAVALLCLAKLDNLEQHPQRAHDCLRKAMSLSKSAQMRSQLWTLIGEAERMRAKAIGATNDDVLSIALQQHYLIRAVQLNKANDEAWLRLALLYYTNGAMVEAHLTIETALKHNPQLAEAWCAWALKAESEGVFHEAMDMFRHSISIKPLASAVMKYAAFLCQSLHEKNFDPATVMIDFNNVLQLRDEWKSKEKELLVHLGVLAELFGHYEDAVQCIADSGHDGFNLQRACIKAGQKVANPSTSLKKLADLSEMATDDLFALLKEKQLLYKTLFEYLVAPEAEELRRLYNTHSKHISVPLVVAAILRFKISICDEAVSVLHDVLPRHELIDVFPTVMPEGLDNGLKYLEQDGEEPFRYSHFIAKPLWEILKKRRDELQEETKSDMPILVQ